MKLTFRALIFSAASAALALSASAATAAETRACAAGTPTAASNTWDFKGEANGIFKDIQSDAQAALDHADILQSYADDSELSWQAHADELLPIKEEINDIGARLCRLETIRRVLAPWQQHAVDQIAETARLMADNAQDAILFLNAHHNVLWLPTYQKYVNNLTTEGQSLAHSVGSAVEFASVSKEYRDLRHEMGPSVTP